MKPSFPRRVGGGRAAAMTLTKPASIKKTWRAGVLRHPGGRGEDALDELVQLVYRRCDLRHAARLGADLCRRRLHHLVVRTVAVRSLRITEIRCQRGAAPGVVPDGAAV